ncbi:endonuclease domain-containing protein [Cupriavidus sp. WS]|uniref:endonuclease domain-containing protein n=1 Tax=Cupriavidus sp. WS TaxID=1312922 RepID=UPI0005BA4AB4|nr:endonuclease domain-containing protein [Cupriavidus sp. WS]
MKSLRANQTEAERRLWYHFRAHRFMGLKIRRQSQLGPFIADFVCMELKLVIEADGSQHGDGSDARRDAWFRRNGFTVLRFWNNEVLGQTDAVLERVREVALRLGHVDAPALSPGPSPASGRGEQTVGSRGRANRTTSSPSELPSPARGRGAGGEGKRAPEPLPSTMPAAVTRPR